MEDPLTDRGGRGTLGGDPGSGEGPRVGDPVGFELLVSLGRARRYHPPVNVSAMS